MIAEYERAQIRERSRRGKAHRARGGSQAVLSGAPYGYRYVRKSQHMDAFYEIDEGEAEIVREVFDRYTERGESIADIARCAVGEWCSDTHRQARVGSLDGVGDAAQPCLPRTGRVRQDADHRPAREAHPSGPRARRAPRPPRDRRDVAPEQWTQHPGPSADHRGDLRARSGAPAGEQALSPNATAREPALLKGILVCRDCGYACWRTSARTTKRVIYYYRCIGSDNYRFVGGRVCANRPIRADELDALVWGAVERLLSDPTLIRPRSSGA